MNELQIVLPGFFEEVTRLTEKQERERGQNRAVCDFYEILPLIFKGKNNLTDGERHRIMEVLDQFSAADVEADSISTDGI